MISRQIINIFMFSNNIFYFANQNSPGSTRLKKMVKVRTLGNQEDRSSEIVLDYDRNFRTLESNKENRIKLRNQAKRNSDSTEPNFRQMKSYKNYLPQFRRESQYKNYYKTSLKASSEIMSQLNYFRGSTKIDRGNFNQNKNIHQFGVSQSISLKLSKNLQQKTRNQIETDVKNMTERKQGRYLNLISKRKEKIQSFNSLRLKSQRQCVPTLKNCLRYQTSSIKGTKEHNQDCVKADNDIWIVCDGHGEQGHDVSWYISHVLYELFQERRAKEKFSISLIRDIFYEVESNLQQTGIDISLSGSTCVMVTLDNQKLYCACTGDSVAIAIFQDLSYEFISSQHKPCNPEQAKRIEFFGGIIKKTTGKEHIPQSPLRMWGQGVDNWGPGLAVSRSFGDKMAQRYGLIYEPQIKQIQRSKSLKYVVIGSDGLFDQVKPAEIANILSIQGRQLKQQGCKLLTQIAQSRWVGYSDDISAIVVYF